MTVHWLIISKLNPVGSNGKLLKLAVTSFFFNKYFSIYVHFFSMEGTDNVEDCLSFESLLTKRCLQQRIGQKGRHILVLLHLFEHAGRK